MKFHSTNKQAKNFSLPEVLRLGLAPDGGLFMPNRLPKLGRGFFAELPKYTFSEIAQKVAGEFISEIPAADLRKMVTAAFNFSVPLKKLDDDLYILELWHGPTLAFKDFGARFMARALGYFLNQSREQLNIIVATSGDTGSAVASGFFKAPNIRVFILYPSGKVSLLQEKQLTTFGANITAVEVRGSFDDCQALAKQALNDRKLNVVMNFSSANSINFGRLLPQSLYYFYGVAKLRQKGIKRPPIFVVPSGNFGNLTAGILAKKMGLPVARFIAATNLNAIVPNYLASGVFSPRQSRPTISNAMDVGNPSNFARLRELYHDNYRQMGKDIIGLSISDSETRQTIKQVYKNYSYLLDPHTAVGIAAARRYQKLNKRRQPFVVLSTAHPAKFKEIVEPIIGQKISLPARLRAVALKKKSSVVIPNQFENLKRLFSVPAK